MANQKRTFEAETDLLQGLKLSQRPNLSKEDKRKGKGTSRSGSGKSPSRDQVLRLIDMLKKD